MTGEEMTLMSNGMQVKSGTGQRYRIVGGIRYAQAPVKENADVRKLLCVSEEVQARYKLLCVWAANGRITEEQERERCSYEELLPVDDLEPDDYIRFITSSYKDLFRVRNLSYITINGEARRVVYIDPTHFYTVPGINCYHICEFAERMEQFKAEVKAI